MFLFVLINIGDLLAPPGWGKAPRPAQKNDCCLPTLAAWLGLGTHTNIVTRTHDKHTTQHNTTGPPQHITQLHELKTLAYIVDLQSTQEP